MAREQGNRVRIPSKAVTVIRSCANDQPECLPALLLWQTGADRHAAVLRQTMRDGGACRGARHCQLPICRPALLRRGGFRFAGKVPCACSARRGRLAACGGRLAARSQRDRLAARSQPTCAFANWLHDARAKAANNALPLHV